MRAVLPDLKLAQVTCYTVCKSPCILDKKGIITILCCFHAVPPEIAVANPDPVFYNEPVQLVCTVIGGDPPRNITWTSPSGALVYFTNQTAGADVSLSITRYDYGEYTCRASNEFGSAFKRVEVQHPGLCSLSIVIITFY